MLSLADALPCPWCGKKEFGISIRDADDAPEHRYSLVECYNPSCGAVGPEGKFMSYDPHEVAVSEAVEAWNKRA